MYRESLKLTEQNIKLATKNEASVVDLTKALSLARELSENLDCATQKRDQLKQDMVKFREKVRKLEEQLVVNEGKIKQLSNELTEANCIFERFNAGSRSIKDQPTIIQDLDIMSHRQVKKKEARYLKTRLRM